MIINPDRKRRNLKMSNVTEEQQEKIVLELVVNGGDARSKAMEAIRLAAKGDFEAADKKLEESAEALNRAHEFQTEMIQAQLRGEEVEVSLIMVHGQDHLMNAITVKDLATEMVAMYKKMKEMEEK